MNILMTLVTFGLKKIYPFIIVPNNSFIEQSSLKHCERLTSRFAAALSGKAKGNFTRFLKDKKGRPINDKGFYWSVSHKKGAGAGVVSDCPVGIDLEIIENVWDKMYDKTATDEEWYTLGGRTKLNFFKNWSAKEAALKLEGDTVFKLNRFKVESCFDKHLILKKENRYYAVNYYINDGYIGAVAGFRGKVSWRKKSITIPD